MRILDSILHRVTPERFGAKGDGTADDSAAINAADAHAAMRNRVLVLRGRYMIASPVSPSVPWVGCNAQIIISPSFAYRGTCQGAVTNPHLQANYDGATADAVRLSGITFVNKAPVNRNGQRETLMLGNVSGGRITNCRFLCTGTDELVDLDIWGPVRNLEIDHCTFEQNTGAGAGGNIWLLGIGASADDFTEGVDVHDCTLTHNAKDEMIAVMSALAPVQNVSIRNCVLVENGSPSATVSVFGNGTLAKTDQWVKNISFTGNSIRTNNTGAFVIRVGLGGEVPASTSSVFILNNDLEIDSENETLVAGIAVGDGVDIHVDENRLNSTGKSVPHAILGPGSPLASCGANVITGNFADQIDGCS